MTIVSGSHADTHKGEVDRAVRVFWSVRRCWHGDAIKLSVRAEHVATSATAELKITDLAGTATIDTISGVALTAGKVDHAYTIDWKAKTIPADAKEFVFSAKIGKLESAASPPLYVELQPPAFSL